jgi:predicted transcriptional regulator
MTEYLNKVHEIVKHYLDSYVLTSRKEENASEVSDAEVIRSIEETLDRYKKLIGKEPHYRSHG